MPRKIWISTATKNIEAPIACPLLADTDLGIGDIFVFRHCQVLRRRTFADTSGRVVMRAVARTEPAAEIALLADGHAAQMGAHADHHQELLLAADHAILV